MFEKMDLFRMAGGLARHASARQSAVARNIANADTPGYRARDLESFSDSLRGSGSIGLARTRPAHLSGSLPAGATSAPRIVPDTTEAPNGNSVSIETEILKTAEIRQHHETALAIYRSTLKVLRSALSPR